MARSARRRSGGRADWVYRGDRYFITDTGSQEANPSGTYGTVITLNSGPANQTAQVLYDSDRTAARIAGNDTATDVPWIIPQASRPDGVGGGALIHAVELFIRYSASTWALGSEINFGWRIIVADQDAELGVAQLDAGYSMWQNVLGGAFTQEAVHANGRQNCAEGRKCNAFSDNGNMFTIHKMVKFKRRLQTQEGLFLFMETAAGSQNLNRLDLYCRTLVTDVSPT
ncbi:hypothetical protein P6U18_21430 [Pseudomonas sp. L01]|nr:hypothetical protein [Pseudomonas sp. L01]